MRITNSPRSTATLLAAANLFTVSSNATPPHLESRIDSQNGVTTHKLTVEYDRKQQGYFKDLQFSTDLRNWASTSTCGCLEQTATNLPASSSDRVRSEFRYQDSPLDQTIFFRTSLDLPPNIHQLHGLNMSLYTDPDENPNTGRSGQISESELRARLAHVAPYTEWVRSFGTSPDLISFGSIAHELGLKTAVGAWISRDAAENRRQIEALKGIALSGNADIVLVGSESILRGDVAVQTLIDYLEEVRTTLRSAGIMVPVATADVYSVFQNNPQLIEACDLIPANFYPFWEQRNIACSLAYLHSSYTALKSIARGKEIIVSETGWPTCGDPFGEAVPSLENSITYLRGFRAWANAHQVKYWLFSSYDQWWSAQTEGPVGACWGIWTGNRQLKPGMETLFSPVQESPLSWITCAGDTPVYDIFTTSNEITTNLRDYLVSGSIRPGDQVRVNGAALPNEATNSLGDFAVTIPLNPGINEILVEVYTAEMSQPIRSVTKRVDYDPSFSTEGRNLIYVNIVPDGSPAIVGTAVIDLDSDSFLGFISGHHVVGISPDASSEIYMEDRKVYSTSSHQEIRQLAFDSPLTKSAFAVSPTDTTLVSRNQVLDLDSNTVFLAPANIETGRSWAGAAYPGGATYTPDGKSVFFGRSDINKLNVRENTVEATGISSRPYLSDLTVSPDGRILSVSTYWSVSFFDAHTYQHLATVGSLPDFNGEVVFSGNYAVIGGAGNPQNGGGSLVAINTNTFEITSRMSAPLADNVTVNSRGDIVASIGEPSDGVSPPRLGIDVYRINTAGKLTRVKSYSLGVNRWIRTFGRPQNDAIRAVICTQ